MPRGRPRKIQPDIENAVSKEVAQAIAELLSHWCGIPGCFGKNHMDEAYAILNLLEKRGNVIT